MSNSACEDRMFFSVSVKENFCVVDCRNLSVLLPVPHSIARHYDFHIQSLSRGMLNIKKDRT